MLRLFVGLEIPDAIAQRLAQLAGGIPGARWSDPRNYHITLSFIGEVEEPSADRIAFALPYVDCLPFSQALRGMGVFEEGNHPKVLWAGAESTPPLNHLRAQVEKALRLAGIDVPYRKYVPHVTLARLQDVSREHLGHFIEAHNLFSAGPFPVDEFILYQSHKSKDGFHYEPIGRYALGSRNDAP